MNNDKVIQFLQLIRPYPSSAERVVHVLAKSGHNAVSLQFIERSAGLGTHEVVRVPQILRAMKSVGIIQETGPGWWVAILEQQELFALAQQLTGAANYQRIHKDRDEVQVVLTLPEEPSKLCEALPEHGPYCVRLGATDSAFTKIAREANHRLVVVTPFVDKVGAEWIAGMFNLTADKPVERILILRDYHTTKLPLANVSKILDDLQVKIFDYHLRHEARRLPFETFHAKFVLGDDVQAYIGSANMLASSLEVALEVGVLVKGESVLDIKRLVDSMVSVSRLVAYESHQ